MCVRGGIYSVNIPLIGDSALCVVGGPDYGAYRKETVSGEDIYPFETHYIKT